MSARGGRDGKKEQEKEKEGDKRKRRERNDKGNESREEGEKWIGKGKEEGHHLSFFG